MESAPFTLFFLPISYLFTSIQSVFKRFLIWRLNFIFTIFLCLSFSFICPFHLMNPSLCEFFAENELIRIVPNFNDRTVHLFCGDFGPFEAAAPVTVPFWLAMLLKRRRKCTIIPPDWLCVDELRRMIVAEVEQNAFSPIPECFFELSNLLMLYAREDVEQYEQLKTLVKDLWDKREAKMRTSTIKFLGQYEIGHGQMDNLTRMEICCARATLVEGSKQLDRLTATLHSIRD